MGYFKVGRREYALALLVLATGLLGLSLQGSALAQSTWTWYKTDLHVHSVLSADAFSDVGILSQSAKGLGYNALFLTDHNLGSSFPISGITANHVVFDDALTRWTPGTYGSLATTTNTLVSSPVHTGSQSVHLVSTAASGAYGETYLWTKRGPNFRSGTITLQVSIYPTRIDPGAGVYVSASIGGDATVEPPVGYTTASGVISPGKSTVLVWQLGAARAPSSDPNARVLTYPLAYTLNTWNTYTLNLSSALADIPAADLPLDYDAVTVLKMAVGSTNGGTANAYFDSYLVTPSAPVDPGSEFVYRNSLIHTYDTASFKVFPAVEMGISKHAQRLNFGITDPAQFVSYTNGIDGILPAQQSGYPAMLNHPGSPGGVSDSEATSTQGEGADLMEVRQQGWINDWDAILQQGVQLLGTGTTDTHQIFSLSSFATYVYAPALDFDTLVHSIFEGRTYIAVGGFGDQGRVIFNPDSASQVPYPARYPVYVPGTQSTVNAHLLVTGGLSSSYTIYWLRNGTVMATDHPTGASYEATKAVALSGAWTYVRAEVRTSSVTIKALTQPLVFVAVSGLPADKSYHVDSVTTADGHKYTKLFTKGITASGWDATSQALTLTLQNPANALVDLRVSTAAGPQEIRVDNVVIPNAGSLAAFQAASGSAWYYDPAASLLYLKVLQAATTASVVVKFSSQVPVTSTATPTATPTTATRTPTATALTPAPTATLQNSPTPIATTTPTAATRTPTATALTPAPTATLQNSPTPIATTTPTATPAGMATFGPVADAYVDSSNPSTNYGKATNLRVDGSPVVNSYLRFNVQGVTGTITKVTLKVYANSSQSRGYDVHGVADTTWVESSLIYNNAPTMGAVAGSSGAVSANTWTSVDVTALVTGNGLVSLGLTTVSTTNLSLGSREAGANAPQLVVQTS